MKKKSIITATIAAIAIISYGIPATDTYAVDDDTLIVTSGNNELQTVEETQPEVETGADIDFDYEGVVSDYSGYSYSGDGISRENVSLGQNVFYDSDKRMYGYILENGDKIYSNVMDGMVVNDKVQISFEYDEDDIEPAITLYKDGKVLKNPEFDYIHDTGDYTVEAVNDDGQTYQIFSFTVVGSITGRLFNYIVPDNFVVQKIVYEGSEVAVTGREIDMTQDGHYKIDYMCTRTEVTYTLSVDVDHTAPELKLKEVKNGVADGPVDISDLEDGATAKITLDGKKYNYRKTLTRSGKYTIVVTDKAGNQSRYEFEILIYFNMSSLAFLGLVVLIIAGVGIYLAVQRKRLRIR